MLKFDIASCIRASSKFSKCEKCVDICPTETIKIVENIPAFTPSECIECGGCGGVCPTEAFSLSNFSPIEFFFKFLENGASKLLCQRDLECCLSALSVEHLISIALATEHQIEIDVEGCKCGGESPKLKNQLLANIEEANFILESISDRKIEIKSSMAKPIFQKDGGSSTDRRSFLSLQGAIKSKIEFERAVEADELKKFDIDSVAVAGIREKRIPDKRKLLFSVLKRQPKPPQYDILAQEDISFTSQKFIEESCTNCQICYRICPTGALSSNGRFSVINFDAMLCLKCHLCHDVCEPKSIQLQKGFELKEFFEPTQRKLVSFNVKRCNECGNYFTYQGGVVECRRCQIEEEEAIRLHI